MRTSIAAASLLLLGCITGRNDLLRKDVQRRAAFDLQCHRAYLRLTELAYEGGTVSSYGVRGCGHRVVYVLSGSTWVLNSDDARR